MRAKRIKQKKIYFITFLVLALVLFYFVYTKFLHINNISWNLNGVECVTLSDISHNLRLKGKMLFKVDQSVVEQELVQDYPCIKSATLTKNLLGSTTITLTPRTAFFKVLSFHPQVDISLSNLEATPSSQSALYDPSIPQNTSTSFLADDQGVVFKQAGGNYPTLYLASYRLKTGDKLDSNLISEVKNILNTVSQLEAEGEIQNFNNNFQIRVEDNFLVCLTTPNLLFTRITKTDPSVQDIYTSLTSLQLILQTAKMNNKSIQSVDLRFDKPVIRYSQTKV